MTDIIPQVLPNQQQPRWQNALKDLITEPLALLAYLEISPQSVPWNIDKNFPLRVTRHFADRIKKGDPHDPLLRQVLSIKEESQLSSSYSCDPLQERNPRYNPLPGLLHKYDSRVLLTFAPSCAIHCRYCFRRHFPYDENQLGKKDWQAILDYIRERKNIKEVILSGGDPLMAQDDSIALFLTSLSDIEHVQFIRFHTRLPVVIPERINESFVNMLASFRFTSTLIYHINHPNEIVHSIAEGVKCLKREGITVLNQSVLLKGINDNTECLEALSIKLYSAGILPYYLHMLDPIQGAAHFDVSLEDAKKLQSELRHRLPGYMVPKVVREVAGDMSKKPI